MSRAKYILALVVAVSIPVMVSGQIPEEERLTLQEWEDEVQVIRDQPFADNQYGDHLQGDTLLYGRDGVDELLDFRIEDGTGSYPSQMSAASFPDDVTCRFGVYDTSHSLFTSWEGAYAPQAQLSTRRVETDEVDDVDVAEVKHFERGEDYLVHDSHDRHYTRLALEYTVGPLHHEGLPTNMYDPDQSHGFEEYIDVHTFRDRLHVSPRGDIICAGASENPLEAIEMPDPELRGVTLDVEVDEPFEAPEEVQIEFEVENEGDEERVGEFEIRIDGEPVTGYPEVESLDPGESKTFEATYNAQQQRTYTVEGRVGAVQMFDTFGDHAGADTGVDEFEVEFEDVDAPTTAILDVDVENREETDATTVLYAYHDGEVAEEVPMEIDGHGDESVEIELDVEESGFHEFGVATEEMLEGPELGGEEIQDEMMDDEFMEQQAVETIERRLPTVDADILFEIETDGEHADSRQLVDDFWFVEPGDVVQFEVENTGDEVIDFEAGEATSIEVEPGEEVIQNAAFLEEDFPEGEIIDVEANGNRLGQIEVAENRPIPDFDEEVEALYLAPLHVDPDDEEEVIEGFEEAETEDQDELTEISSDEPVGLTAVARASDQDLMKNMKFERTLGTVVTGYPTETVIEETECHDEMCTINVMDDDLPYSELVGHSVHYNVELETWYRNQDTELEFEVR